jgi:DnaJ homolog subfamily C member 19
MKTDSILFPKQGRAGLVAWRRSRGGVGAMGKAFYKGGFEPKMTKKEASLILSLK